MSEYSNPFKNRYRFVLVLVVLLFGVLLALGLYASEQVKARDLDILSNKTVINLYEVELDIRQNVIMDQLDEINKYTSQVIDLENQLSSLEYEIESRVCQSVSLEEFKHRVLIDNAYVITPEKMQWTGYWWIREDVLFERENELARGYEVRVDLTPSDYSDDWQEIHTTIRAFDSPGAVLSFFEGKGTADNKSYFDTNINLGIPIKIWIQEPRDADNTVTISMLCEYFQFDIKTKGIADTDQAIGYLEQAATMLVSDLSVWVP